MLHDQGLDAYIIDAARPRAKADDVDWDGWSELLDAVHDPKHEVTIGLVGKYIDLPDAYLSVTEALKAGGFAQRDQGQRSSGSRPTSARRPRAPQRTSPTSTASAFPAGSACAASRASSARCSSPARTASRCSASASACSAW